ncbi:MAG: class B sortase [Lachnospiraceae bacterium]|nr:class B sortase [Lachnospiraceae bacterium]
MSTSNSSGRPKRRSFGLIRTLILLTAIAVFCYSGYRLFVIFNGYRQADQEYDDIADTFTQPFGNPPGGENRPEGETSGKEESGAEKSGEPSLTDGETEEEPMLVEDADPPISVDWKELGEINPDIVGWLYVDALPGINYPICQSSDNDFYLHRTFRQQYLFAGSIFEDCHNRSDFTDPNTIVYGHNMRNGSMFGSLKQLKDPAKYEAAPYFWILTPKGNYRYHIFSIFTTDVSSDVYVLYDQNGSEFLAWEKRIAAASEAAFDIPLSKNDKTVILSTCTSDSSKRNVVIGKCVSSDRPFRAEGQREDPAPHLLEGIRTSLDAAIEAGAGMEIYGEPGEADVPEEYDGYEEIGEEYEY